MCIYTDVFFISKIYFFNFGTIHSLGNNNNNETAFHYYYHRPEIVWFQNSKKNLDMKENAVDVYTKKNFYQTGFFHQIFNYQ